METATLLTKLLPLIPKQVQLWWSLLNATDAATRSLLEKHIAAQASQLLGDYRVKPLLSLPTPGRARGSIALGTILYEKTKWPLGISEAELLQNLAIFGRSGAGKTNAAFLILQQLVSRKIPFLFLDWKRTGRHLLPHLKRPVRIYTPGRSLSPFPFNSFVIPPGIEQRVHVNHVIDVLADAYTLGDGARSILQRALTKVYGEKDAPSISQLVQAVNAIPDRERIRGWKISALRALETLAFATPTPGTAEAASGSAPAQVLGASVSGGDQQAFAETLLDQNTIIELDGLSASSKKFLVPLLCHWLYSVRLSDPGREKLRFVIFIEEAHHLLYGQPRAARETLMEMVFRQCRELGISIVVIDQHPHLISTAALGNTYTTLCLNLKDPKDVNKAADLSLVEDRDRRIFSRLPVGQAVVKLQDRWTEPILIRTPLIEIEKGSVSDGDVARLMREYSTGSGPSGGMKALFPGVRRVRVWDDPLEDDGLLFMEDVLAHPQDGVRARYRRMGLSGDKGNRLKQDLLFRGWLEGELIARGRTRILMLRPTAKAREWLGLDREPTPHEGIAHAYWKQHYANRFAEAGYRVVVEAPRVGGRVDVLARRAGIRIGIEIETGKSDVSANVRNGLRSRFDRVIIVATDETAMKAVETALAKSDLLIPGRVVLALREQSPTLTEDDEVDGRQAA